MRVRLVSLGAALCGCCIACGGNSPAPPSPSPGAGSGGATQITGSERLGWSQAAPTQGDLSALRFNIYVDGARQVMGNVSCGPLQANLTADCAGSLPALTTGAHSLTLSAVNSSGEESAQSAALQVVVVRAVTALTGQPLPGGPAVPAMAGAPGAPAPGGAEVAVVAAGFDDPTDLAVAADGRVLVTERSGRVRIADRRGLQAQPALQLEDVELAAGATGGLLSLALDPAFDRTRWVYLVYTAAEGFRVARFREVAGRLGERAVLLDGVTASSQASANLRFGPDGKLYVALDDGGDPRAPGDLGSFNGKLLRLNPDGSVPDDQAGFSPVYVANLTAARSFDWVPESGALWVTDGRRDSGGTLDAIVDEARMGRRAQIATRYALPGGEVASSALFYEGRLITAWTGDLLVALPESAQLLRMTLDEPSGMRVASTETVVDGAAGRIRSLAAAADGQVYLINDDSLLVLSNASAPGIQ